MEKIEWATAAQRALYLLTTECALVHHIRAFLLHGSPRPPCDTPSKVANPSDLLLFYRRRNAGGGAGAGSSSGGGTSRPGGLSDPIRPDSLDEMRVEVRAELEAEAAEILLLFLLPLYPPFLFLLLQYNKTLFNNGVQLSLYERVTTCFFIF